MKQRFIFGFILFLSLSLMVGAVFGVPAAQAQTSRLYFSGYMGLNMNRQGDFTENVTPQNGSLKMNNAISFAGAIGLRLTRRWRVEGELSYRKADMDRVNFANAGSFKTGGELKTWIAMANGYYDFDLGWKKLTPFVTAGLGIARHEGEINDLSGLAVSSSDSDVAIAWQMGTGVKMQLNERTAITGAYRYLGTTAIQLGAYDMDYANHEFRLGLEYDIPVDFLK